MHPDSLTALAEAGRRPTLMTFLPWVLVAVLVVLLFLKK